MGEAINLVNNFKIERQLSNKFNACYNNLKEGKFNYGLFNN